MTKTEKQPSKARQSIARRTAEADSIRAMRTNLAAPRIVAWIVKPLLMMEELHTRPLAHELRSVEKSEDFARRMEERTRIRKHRDAVRIAELMKVMPPRLEQAGPFVLSAEEAYKLYQEGVKTRRKPEPMIDRSDPKRPDLNSWHFRGLKAVWAVTKAFPRDIDPTTGKQLPRDPSALEAHLASGLEEIRGMGSRPLADDFVDGYEGWAKKAVEGTARVLDRRSVQN